jgi:hypothetical protein
MKNTIIAKRAILLLVTVILVLGLACTSAFATVHETSSVGVNQNFNSAWTVVILNSANHTFKIGYNTVAINEDFTHTYNYNGTHKAYVKNTSRALEVTKPSLTYAKAEITHAPGTVFYRFTY